MTRAEWAQGGLPQRGWDLHAEAGSAVCPEVVAWVGPCQACRRMCLLIFWILITQQRLIIQRHRAHVWSILGHRPNCYSVFSLGHPNSWEFMCSLYLHWTYRVFKVIPTQVIEHLSSKSEALSSKNSTTKKKKKVELGEIELRISKESV
jgi:hypothetical protein